MTIHPIRSPLSLPTLALAGLAGGLAEAGWIALYSSLGVGDTSEVLRQVTASFNAAAASSTAGPALGMLIHMSLALALGMAYGRASQAFGVHRLRLAPTFALAAMTLAAVWAFNFFVLLPQINPTFVGLLPYAVTFASKQLFALAMASVLYWRERPAASHLVVPA